MGVVTERFCKLLDGRLCLYRHFHREVDDSLVAKLDPSPSLTLRRSGNHLQFNSVTPYADKASSNCDMSHYNIAGHKDNSKSQPRLKGPSGGGW